MILVQWFDVTGWAEIRSRDGVEDRACVWQLTGRVGSGGFGKRLDQKHPHWRHAVCVVVCDDVNGDARGEISWKSALPRTKAQDDGWHELS